MSTNWKIDRHFDYDSVSYYYVNKIKAFPTTVLESLPKTKFSTLHELGEHLKEEALSIDIELRTCSLQDMYLWGEYLKGIPVAKQSDVWRFREYIFACSMLFVGNLVKTAQNSKLTNLELISGKPRAIPTDFVLNEHSFTIVGSSELTSDIDITIQGPRASFLISIIEDIFELLTTQEDIPIRCWDVEFYGDFHLLQMLFVNSSRFNSEQRLNMLKYAIVSYFRSTHQGSDETPEISPSVEFLIKYCLASVGYNQSKYNTIVDNAYNFWKTTAPNGNLNRELFYRFLSSVESDSTLLSSHLQTTNKGITISNNEKIQDATALASKMFETISHANIHRAESYILPSTAVQVVEIEQKKVNLSSGGLPSSWFSSNARIGIDKYFFVLSAIEQLGYLEHYHPSDVVCNKKGIKYFGRYVRALTKAGLISESSPFTGIYKELNTYRSTKDPTITCKYNVHDLLQQILKELNKAPVSKGGKLRRTRRRKMAKHKRSHRTYKK